MFDENREHGYYLGFIKRVFEDIQNKSKLIRTNSNASKNYL
jgi:hypothetical protein